MKRKKYEDLPENFLRLLGRSEQCKAKGEHESAVKLAEKVLMHDPVCLEAIEEVADNLLSLERFEEARKAANFAYSLDKESYIANFVLGFLASQAEDWQAAIKYLSVANKNQVNNPEIMRCLGWAMFHERDVEGGLVLLRRALVLRSDDPAILCDLAACLLQINHFENALELLQHAEVIKPEDHRVQDLLRVTHTLLEKAG